MAGKPYPWMQFWPTDWLKDTRILSLGCRGFWIDLIAYMHPDGEWTGTLEHLARMVGGTAEEVRSYLEELRDTGTADVTCHEASRGCHGETWTLVSRRMKKEANERTAATKRKQRQRAKASKPRPAHVPPPRPANVPPMSQTETESETESETEIEKKAPSPVEEVLPETFEGYWNQKADAVQGLVPLLAMDEPLRRELKARCEDPWWVEHWLEALAAVPSCLWHVQNGKATPDWFLKEGTVRKILQGNFKATEKEKAQERKGKHAMYKMLN